MATYTLLVKFERELSDDEACVKSALEKDPEAYGRAKTQDERLVIQLAKEIQEAVEEYGLPAGQFQIVSMPKHGDEITDAECKGPF